MKQEKQFVDLHSHTLYSDGMNCPQDLVINAKMKGTEVFAITDHDTMAAYKEGKEEAEKWGLTLVPGVEVTVDNYHILGLNVDPNFQPFQDFLQRSRDIQESATRVRVGIMQKHGIPITMEKIKKLFSHPQARLGRWSIIYTMLQDPEGMKYFAENNRGQTPDQIFRHYLGSKGIAGRIPKYQCIDSLEAITAIHEAGGIAAIAHPFKQVKDMKELDVLREMGMDGLEIQPNYTDRNIPFQQYAEKNGLKVTYGSDFHGPAFHRKLLGKEYGNELDVRELFGKPIF